MTMLPLMTDSYKLSHYLQYPPGMTQSHCYFESRGGEYDKVVFFGLQYYLTKLSEFYDIKRNLNDISHIANQHGLPFNNLGWKKVERLGYLPIKINAIPEGTAVPPGIPMFTVTNTHPDFAWLPTYLETMLMKVWYPCTVATKAYHIKRMMHPYWLDTADDIEGLDFAYHNFGDRGSTSIESALLNGMAHLTQFKGTDNFGCLSTLELTYDSNDFNVGFSIPASEHSTVTSWGEDKEMEFYDYYLEQFKPYPMIACVLDSYDIFKAVNYVTSVLKDKIESPEYPVFVMRPDSGNILKVLDRILNIMEQNKVSYYYNKKGYKVWNKYRIIWGDGITPDTIKAALELFKLKGYSAQNLAFGSGGDLVQNITRDTCKFAYKMSAAVINGETKDVYKNPVTDTGKASKKGIIGTYWDTEDEVPVALNEIQYKLRSDVKYYNLMDVVYLNGSMLYPSTFEDIRNENVL